MSTWTITNDRGLELIGNTHRPASNPEACVVLMHGFLGYKDYGFIPVLAERLCDRGIVVHRFNFSCSGMTNQIETFERTDLFELDTWGRQIEDVQRVCRAVGEGELFGTGLPLHLVGHSRGGDTALLTAGQSHGELNLAGVVTINAPADCCRLAADVQSQLIQDGFLEVRSGRTGQALRVGAAWLAEQLSKPEAHDLEVQAARIGCPALVLQGDADDTVPMSDAQRLTNAGGATLVPLVGGTHVLNVSNPADRENLGSVFEGACEAVKRFVLGR